MNKWGWGLLALGGAYAGWRALKREHEVPLVGKVALVTGASRGLGLLLAKELASTGARLVICARNHVELDEAKRELEELGAEVLAVTCDISDRRQVEAMAGEAIARFGGVDLVINNAGVIEVGPLETMRHEDFERDMAINFWGAVNTTLALLPALKRSPIGRLVFIDSIGGRIAVPHLLPYSCAKFALRGFAEGLRAELDKDAVRVTVILPGLMRTGSPMNALFKGQPSKEFTWFALADSTPLAAMDATRAARLILQAARRGEAELTLSWQAKLVGLAHDLFPGPTMHTLGLVNRLLPRAPLAPETRYGRETDMADSRLMAPVEHQALRTNQYVGKKLPHGVR